MWQSYSVLGIDIPCESGAVEAATACTASSVTCSAVVESGADESLVTGSLRLGGHFLWGFGRRLAGCGRTRPVSDKRSAHVTAQATVCGYLNPRSVDRHCLEVHRGVKQP